MADDKKNKELADVIAQAVAQGVAQAIPQVIAQMQQTRPVAAHAEPARGRTRTRRGSENPPQVIVPLPAPVDLRSRLRVALTRESLDAAKLSRAVGESVDAVQAEIRLLRAEGKVVNVGFEEVPMWTWRVGDDVDTQTLMRVVERLISERPMRLREIVWATGAKESRVSGVMVEIQRRKHVVDMSGGGHAKIYFLVENSPGTTSDSGKSKPVESDGRYMIPSERMRSASLLNPGSTRGEREAAKQHRKK